MTQSTVLANRYRLDRLLGEGGMGQVWLAYDLVIYRGVAVKQLSGSAPDPQSIERALREARAAGRLHHPHAVAVYDVLTVDGLPYLVMEYVQGGTLADRMKTGPVPPSEAAALGAQIASALAAAHRLGIIHRDVKPANILIDEQGSAKLADFGIAHDGELTQLTATGLFIGTIAYMAPEVAEGQTPTPSGDVWSLGATLWAAVEGHPVFEGTSPVAVLAQLISRPVPVPMSAGALTPLLVRMLDRDPGARPSAQQVSEELSAQRSANDPTAMIAQSRPTVALPLSQNRWAEPASDGGASTRGRPAHASRKWLIGSAALGLVGAATAVAVVLGQGSGSGDQVNGSGTKSTQSAPSGAVSTPVVGSGSGTTSASSSVSSSVSSSPTSPTDPPGPLASGRLASARRGGPVDIKSVSWRVTATTLFMDVDFYTPVPDFFKEDSSLSPPYSAQLWFDTDDNINTGCGNTDYAVFVYTELITPDSFRNDAKCKTQEKNAALTRTTTRRLADGIEFAVPRGELAAAGRTIGVQVITTHKGTDDDSVPAAVQGEFHIGLP